MVVDAIGKHTERKIGRMTRIDIISGFLGAGKTTLIKKLLKEALAGTKVVLIENEFGEIGIDGGFLQEAGIEIREMNAGCICCSLVGDFGTSLQEVMTKYAPERILIEPSGVGKLSDVMNAIKNVADENGNMELNAAVTVIDCTKAKLYIKNFGEFITDQLESAGTIILTRTDKADQKKIEETVDLIKTYNKKATVITTPLAELDGKDILETFEGTKDLAAEILKQAVEAYHHDLDDDDHDHHHHDHDDDEHGHHHHHDHDDEHDHHHHDHDDEHGHHHHDHDDEHGHHHHDHDDDEHGHHHHDHDDDDHDHDDGVVVHHTHEYQHEHGIASGEHHHHHHHHGHDADEVFGSWGMETPHRYSEETIRRLIAALEDRETYGFILRAKGVLQDEAGNWIEFDHVPEETEIRAGAHPDVTGKIVVIGAELQEENLEKLFREK